MFDALSAAFVEQLFTVKSVTTDDHLSIPIPRAWFYNFTPASGVVTWNNDSIKLFVFHFCKAAWKSVSPATNVSSATISPSNASRKILQSL